VPIRLYAWQKKEGLKFNSIKRKPLNLTNNNLCYLSLNNTITMYTYDNWKRIKKDLGLKNKDIAEILGLALRTIEDQLRPSKELPTWARGMIYVYEQLNAVKLMEFPKQGANHIIPVARDIIEGLVSEKVYDCGCRKQNNIFFKSSTCKLPKEEHKF